MSRNPTGFYNGEGSINVLDGDTDGGCGSMAECGSMLEWRKGRGIENKLYFVTLIIININTI